MVGMIVYVGVNYDDSFRIEFSVTKLMGDTMALARYAWFDEILTYVHYKYLLKTIEMREKSQSSIKLGNFSLPGMDAGVKVGGFVGRDR